MSNHLSWGALKNTRTKINNRYYNLKPGSSKVYKLDKCEDDGFTFGHSPFFGQKEELKVNFTDLPKWKKHKGATPSMCSAAVVAKLLVHDSAVVDDELAKATVQQVLLETIRKNRVEASSLAFTFGPTAVWAAKALKKGDLKLFPAGTVSRIKGGNTKGKLIQVDCSFCRQVLCNFKFQSSPRFLCRKRSARFFPLGQANCRS